MAQCEGPTLNGALEDTKQYKWHSTFAARSLEDSDKLSSHKGPCKTAGMQATNIATEEAFDKHIEKIHGGTPFANIKKTDLYPLRPSKHEMPDHVSYHGEIDAATSEQRLQRSGRRHTHLTRFSVSNKVYLMSAINNQGKAVHFELVIDNDAKEYSLKGTKQVFPSLDELVAHFQKNRLCSTVGSLGETCVAPDIQQQAQLNQQAQQELQAQQEQQMEQPPQGEQPQQLQLLQDTLRVNQEALTRLANEQQRMNQEILSKLNKSKCTIL